MKRSAGGALTFEALGMLPPSAAHALIEKGIPSVIALQARTLFQLPDGALAQLIGVHRITLWRWRQLP